MFTHLPEGFAEFAVGVDCALARGLLFGAVGEVGASHAVLRDLRSDTGVDGGGSALGNGLVHDEPVRDQGGDGTRGAPQIGLDHSGVERHSGHVRSTRAISQFLREEDIRLFALSIRYPRGIDTGLLEVQIRHIHVAHIMRDRGKHDHAAGSGLLQHGRKKQLSQIEMTEMIHSDLLLKTILRELMLGQRLQDAYYCTCTYQKESELNPP